MGEYQVGRSAVQSDGLGNGSRKSAVKAYSHWPHRALVVVLAHPHPLPLNGPYKCSALLTLMYNVPAKPEIAPLQLFVMPAIQLARVCRKSAKHVGAQE